jgi:cell fate regulator YaaT (PSP1 superfamily)
MKLIEVQYTFDNSKLIFYFTYEGRVDFRELVRDLASVFRTRIELRQIGIRDEAKMLGGLGICGRSLCCSTFLSELGQVSIKIAKEQSLSLNSAKISGNCGRLMCCLRYEHETYEEEIRRTPPVDTMVQTADGVGVVIEIQPLAGLVKVRLLNQQENSIQVYDRDAVTPVRREDRPAEGNGKPRTENPKRSDRNQEKASVSEKKTPAAVPTPASEEAPAEISSDAAEEDSASTVES